LLNLEELGWQPRDLKALEEPFTKQEVQSVVLNTPKEKAPGPDGYIGIFFSHCWNTIKEDILKAVDQFYRMDQQDLHFLNQGLVVLIPKKKDPSHVKDYKPISLTHSFSKLISKLLANRLGPQLESLISVNQATFIKKCAFMTASCMSRRQSEICTKEKSLPSLSSLIFPRPLIQ
jgi:hypothetical protein